VAAVASAATVAVEPTPPATPAAAPTTPTPLSTPAATSTHSLSQGAHVATPLEHSPASTAILLPPSAYDLQADALEAGEPAVSRRARALEDGLTPTTGHEPRSLSVAGRATDAGNVRASQISNLSELNTQTFSASHPECAFSPDAMAPGPYH
jgi:hypothetical protein